MEKIKVILMMRKPKGMNWATLSITTKRKKVYQFKYERSATFRN